MYEVGSGCWITAQHPYCVQPHASTAPQWLIPECSPAHTMWRECNTFVQTLCNYVLVGTRGSMVLVGDVGVGCITLAHELCHPDVAHPLWGGAAIRHCLRKFPDYPLVMIRGKLTPSQMDALGGRHMKTLGDSNDITLEEGSDCGF